MDIEALWEYEDPAASEARFRAALEQAEGDLRLELVTQIARSFSLRDRYEEAHRLLDEVERELAGAGTRPRLRYLLERGRTFNSGKELERARGLFVQAWELGQQAAEPGLAVDAAHMVAITLAGTPEAGEWNRRGLAIARSSNDAKAQALIPAMLNNGAWDLFDMGDFAAALPLFEQALAEWTARGRPRQIRAAQSAFAQCLEALGRHAEALAMQRQLEVGARGSEVGLASKEG
jgi:tetratricopeptide (TPR) repeat protein